MIGLFGGTFDPVHQGHIQLALSVQQALALSEVRWIPLCSAVHKRQPIASPAQRLAMLQLAIRDYPAFWVEDIELQRGGASYTVDTLVAMRQHWPHHTLCWLAGTDAMARFSTWKAPQRLLQLAHIIVVQRVGYTLDLPDWLAGHGCDSAAALHQQSAGLIYQHRLAPAAVSSTTVRQGLMQGQDIAAMLPQSVLNFIQQQGLYKPESIWAPQKLLR